MPEEYEGGDADELAQPPPFFPLGPDGGQTDDRSPVRVVLEGVYRSDILGQAQHFVRLEGRDRALSIVIGAYEAQAILLPLQDVKSDRPMTHDLLRNLIERFGARVAMVTIDDLWNDVYYAKLHLEAGKERYEIDARPSDALALAARFEAPIYVSERVFDIANVYEDE